MKHMQNRSEEQTKDFLSEAETKIHERLKSSLPLDVYDRWIQYFSLEKVQNDRVVFHYCGKASLRAFKKRYGEMTRIHICSILGRAMKLTIIKKKAEVVKDAPAKKGKLFLSFLWIAALAALLLAGIYVGTNYKKNQNFREKFYSVGTLKVNGTTRILQITDQHLSQYGNDNGILLERIEKLKPHLILMTGDMIDASETNFDRITAFSHALSEIAPTCYVYGNNEIEMVYGFALTKENLDEVFDFTDDNRDPAALLTLEDPLEKALEEAGVSVLKNETATFELSGGTVDVFGVLTANPSSFWLYGETAFGAYMSENPYNLKVVAAHEPVLFSSYPDTYWGDLAFAGHTHGGVAILPVLGPAYTHEDGFLPERQGAYAYGRKDLIDGTLIVSSGLDKKSILRLNNPPEIVVCDTNTY